MMSRTSAALLFTFGLASIAACSSGNGGGNEAPADAGVNQIDAAPRPDAAPPVQPVRFVMMGDTGTGSDKQYAVGRQVADVCANRGCDFVTLLGDNFYNSGVDDVNDPLWQEYFELPYAPVSDDVPFYPVLGNHDYGGLLSDIIDTGGLGNEFDKGPIEVAYSAMSAKWTMPNTHYTVRIGNVGFIMLDTNSIMWDDTTNGDQEAWYATALQELDGADWIIASGHHPYRSNGAHGNAGNYESIEVAGQYIPNPVNLLNGNHVKDFFDTHVCGTVDMYFAGHDHNRQWIDEPEALCGAHLVVSGAGAKTKDLQPRGNNTLFEDATKPGFAYVVIEGDDLTLEFIDSEGNIEFTHSVTRTP